MYLSRIHYLLLNYYKDILILMIMSKVYEVTKLICPNQKGNYNDYKIFIRLDKIIKASGYIYIDIMEGDLIEGPFTNKNNEDIYQINKSYKIMLPQKPIQQKVRIQKLLNTNINTDDIGFFNSIGYGVEFWIKVYKCYNNCQDLDGCTMNVFKSLDIIGKHILKYYDSLLIILDEELKKKNIINLYRNQKIELMIHPYFGFYIDSWKEDNLYKLFDIKGFAINTILKIATGINASIDIKTELLLISILNDKHICIKYNYENWINILNSSKILESLNISDITQEKFNQIIENIISKGKIIKIGEYLYSAKMYDYEMNITETLINLSNNCNIINQLGLNEEELLIIIKNYEFKKRDDKDKVLDIKYELNNEQQEGIITLFKNNVSIIHGKAGTGKSTLITGIVHCINELEKNISIYFLTPTAKAKMRIKQIIDDAKINSYRICDYQTIHSFNIMIQHNCYSYLNQLQDDNIIKLFIIDETSMIDIQILNELLLLISNYNCCLLFLGDVRQLPSIGPGDFLNKMILSKCIKSTELTQVVRNSGNLTILLNKIINKEHIDLSICDGKMVKWIVPKTDDYNEIIKSTITNNNIIITTTNNTIKKYTDIIRDIKNPKDNKKEIVYNKRLFRENDIVIHTKNFNNKGLINGLSGKIKSIYENQIEIKIKDKTIIKIETIIKVIFDNNLEFNYYLNKEHINYLEPAYLITVHKSQGSEYDHVIFLITNKSMLSNKLLYTAISRAKKSITLIITEEFIKYGIMNKESRKTLMKEMFLYHNQDQGDKSFELFYLEHKNKFSGEIILVGGVNYILNSETKHVYDQNGILFGIYNTETDKIKRISTY